MLNKHLVTKRLIISRLYVLIFLVKWHLGVPSLKSPVNYCEAVPIEMVTYYNGWFELRPVRLSELLLQIKHTGKMQIKHFYSIPWSKNNGWLILSNASYFPLLININIFLSQYQTHKKAHYCCFFFFFFTNCQITTQWSQTRFTISVPQNIVLVQVLHLH